MPTCSRTSSPCRSRVGAPTCGAPGVSTSSRCSCSWSAAPARGSRASPGRRMGSPGSSRRASSRASAAGRSCRSRWPWRATCSPDGSGPLRSAWRARRPTSAWRSVRRTAPGCSSASTCRSAASTWPTGSGSSSSTCRSASSCCSSSTSSPAGSRRRASAPAWTSSGQRCCRSRWSPASVPSRSRAQPAGPIPSSWAGWRWPPSRSPRSSATSSVRDRRSSTCVSSPIGRSARRMR